MSGNDATCAGRRGDAVSLEDVLASRELRVRRQAMLLERHRVPVVSLTIVMPGPVKDNRWARRALQEGMVAFDRLCERTKWPVLAHEHQWLPTGPEALYAVNADAVKLKASAIELEDNRPIGRLWDFDIIGLGMSAISRKAFGFPPRRCLVCQQPAHECGRARRHSVDLLLATIRSIIEVHDADARD
jgi:holo-ACP synthase